MKHWCKILFTLLLGCWCASAAFAQNKVGFIVSGQDKGFVPAMKVGNVTYVDAQKTARKFGANVELFAQSKQAKISSKGFYAILTAPLAEIIVNAQQQVLSAPVKVDGGNVMTPVEFFTLPAFQNSIGKQVEFKDGSFYVERVYNLAYEDKKFSGKDTLLVFDGKDVSFKTQQPNKHTVIVTFPNATIKRDQHLRLRTSYIASADMRQSQKEAVLKVLLGSEAKDWSFTQTDGKYVFRAGKQKAPPVLTAEPEKPEEKPAKKPEKVEKSGKKAPMPATIGPAKEAPAVEKEPVLVATPSVLTESEEEVKEPAPAPKQAQVAPAKAEKPSPVMKPAPTAEISPAHKKMRIVVDPGHGGKDPGAVRNRYREKDWNLAVGKELAKLLKKAGFEVKMTREDDTFIALSERSRMANNFKADLFVSVHTNASKNKNANGFQVYFRSEKATDREAAEVAALENEAMQYEEVHYNFVDALLQSLAKNEYINESSKLAGYVRNAVYKQPGIGIAVNQNSSVRQANFYVLKGVNSPAILVEMGYISSQKDRGRLSTSSARDKMALGIYNGVRNYAKQEGWIN